jgi:RNA polymerase-binding transcription factor DksA
VTWRFNETRNATARLDLARAKVRQQKPCERCGGPIQAGRRRKYCLPCAADSYDEKLAARRGKTP